MFSCEYCEIFKNTYFEEHLRTAVSVISTEYKEKFYWSQFPLKSNKISCQLYVTNALSKDVNEHLSMLFQFARLQIEKAFKTFTVLLQNIVNGSG